MQNYKKNRFNKLLHLSYSLNTKSPQRLQEALYFYTTLSNIPIYTFNQYKGKYISLELLSDINKLKTLTNKYTDKYWLNKYKLTKLQQQELNYFLNYYSQDSTRGLQASIQPNTTQFTFYPILPQIRSNKAVSNLFTIGYEGKSIDEFIQILNKNNIQTLIDIRNNPYSYKYLYSKDDLKKILPKFQIQYFHFGTLGIEGKIRNQESISLSQLWKHYKNKITTNKLPELIQLQDVIQGNNTCLMCFECNHLECHRNILSKHLKPLIQRDIIHL